VIILHGLTVNGYNDDRLTGFASHLALCGFQAYTPHIEGMAELDLRYDDVERLVDDVKAAGRSHPKVGIIGFSVGGTYGLITAAQKKVRDRIGFVLAAGAYYSIENLIENVLTDPDSDIYSRLAIAYDARECLDLSKKELREFEEIMKAYCHMKDSFTKEEMALQEKIGKKATKGYVLDWWKSKSDKYGKLDLSLNPYLRNIDAPVFLMHAAEDKMVPVEETLKIQKELKKRGKEVGVLLTETTGHTSYVGTSPLGVLKIFHRIMQLSG
jgi:esterase/lipase